MLNKHKKSISPLYMPSLPHSCTMMHKKINSKHLLSNLYEESRINNFDELLTRSEILNEEQSQKLLTIILKKEPEDRSHLEIEFLEKKMQKFDFFTKTKDKIPTEYYLELFKELRFESHQKNSVIFSFGDIGKKIFIILKGSVYVLVPKIKVQKEDNLLKKKYEDLYEQSQKNETFILAEEESPKLSPMISYAKTTPNNFFAQEEDSIEKLLEKFPNFILVNTLKKGTLFGEISLTLREPRTATIVCKEDSSFCILKAAAFEKILKANYDKELNFLQNVSLFNGMSLQNIAILKGYLVENVYNKDFVLFRPGNLANEIFIIKEGEVEIYKTLEANKNCSDAEISLQHSVMTYAKHKLLPTKQTYTLIRNLTIGQTIGEEEIFLKEKKRNCFAIVSTSKAKILTLEKEAFLANLKSLRFLKKLEQAFRFKIKWQENNINKIMKLRHLNEDKKQISHHEKSEAIQNLMHTENGKNKFLKSLTLNRVKSKDALVNHPNSKSTHLIKPLNLGNLPQKMDRSLKTERKDAPSSFYDEKGNFNISISPILKMSVFSQLQQKKKRFSMPNIKILLENYEKDLKKQIIYKVCKANSQLESKIQNLKKPDKFEKNQDNSNKNTNSMAADMKHICKSLKLESNVAQKILERIRQKKE